jgi:peptide/nickel transport system permease protein
MNGMKKLLRSLAQTLILIVGITFLSFTLSYLSPGDPAQQMLKRSGMMVTEETLQKARHELGLDQPMLVQYGLWLRNLAKGDMGTSVKSRKAVALELGKRLPNTALLALVSMLLVIAISTPVGLLCAWWKDGPLDNAFRFVTYLFASLPSFFISLILLYVLALRLKWFPVIGSVSVKRIVPDVKFQKTPPVFTSGVFLD